jgi:DNA-binding NtrC family response regulator
VWGHKALDFRGREKIDCILTDLKMPDMDGLELADRAGEIVQKNVPVIVMTGFPSLESAIEALRKRVYDYFVKPFNINRVFSTVEKAIADVEGNHTDGSSDGQA